jgi:hypothetical protein
MTAGGACPAAAARAAARPTSQYDGREMIQARVDIEPDSPPIRHFHPGVRNVGTGTATELATYVVEKGKPLLTVAQ